VVWLNNKSDFVATGTPGLDELLGGGIPRGHTVSVFGGPGSGKTTFALQFLYNGATKYDEPGLFVSLDESPSLIKRHVHPFGWNLDDLEKRKKFIILDASPLEYISSVAKIGVGPGVKLGSLSASSLTSAIKTGIDKIVAKRLVIDPMSMLLFQYPDVNERRKAVITLIRTLRKETGCTGLLIMDLRAVTLERKYQPEEYLTEGTILFQTIAQPEIGLTRVIHIEKMRDTDHDTQPHPYRITNQGIQVFPKEKIYAFQ